MRPVEVTMPPIKNLPWLKILQGICLLTILVYLFQTLNFWFHLIQIPFQLNIGEGVILIEFAELVRGYDIYEVSENLFRAANYGPLYYLLGKSVWPILPFSYLPMRIVSLLFVCMLGICAQRIFRKIGLNQSDSILFALLLPLSPTISYWGAYVKPDILGASFAALALLLYLRRENMCHALPALVLSFYFKQSFIALPIAIGIYELTKVQLVRNAKPVVAAWITIARKAVIAILAFASVYIFLEFFVFPGGSVFTHLITFNTSEFSKHQFEGGIVSFFTSLTFFPLLVSIFLRPRLKHNLFFLYALVSLLWSSIAVGKAGSDLNYFLEPFIAGVIFLGHSWKTFTERNKTSSTKLGISYGLLALLLIISPYPRMTLQLRMDQRIIDHNRTQEKKIRDLIPENSLIHCEVPGVVATMDKPFRLLIGDPVLFHLTTSAGTYDNVDLLKTSIEEGKLSVIISRTSVVHKNYRLRDEFFYFDGFMPVRLFLYSK